MSGSAQIRLGLIWHLALGPAVHSRYRMSVTVRRPTQNYFLTNQWCRACVPGNHNQLYSNFFSESLFTTWHLILPLPVASFPTAILCSALSEYSKGLQKEMNSQVQRSQPGPLNEWVWPDWTLAPNQTRLVSGSRVSGWMRILHSTFEMAGRRTRASESAQTWSGVLKHLVFWHAVTSFQTTMIHYLLQIHWSFFSVVRGSFFG